MLTRFASAVIAALALTGVWSGRVSREDPRPSVPTSTRTLTAASFVDLDEQHALDVERQQVATYLAAVAAAEEARRAQAAAEAVIWARWTAVGRCEQPGGGEGGVEWTVQSSTYSGGLGISNAAWRQWGGLSYASNAGLATPWQQMLVAETIMNAVGRRAWGCPVP